MKDNIPDNTRERVALDLAQIIRDEETQLNLADSKKPREYWFDLYHQCLMLCKDYDFNEIKRMVKSE